MRGRIALELGDMRVHDSKYVLNKILVGAEFYAGGRVSGEEPSNHVGDYGESEQGDVGDGANGFAACEREWGRN